jgi:hypothetical protein
MPRQSGSRYLEVHDPYHGTLILVAYDPPCDVDMSADDGKAIYDSVCETVAVLFRNR